MRTLQPPINKTVLDLLETGFKFATKAYQHGPHSLEPVLVITRGDEPDQKPILWRIGMVAPLRLMDDPIEQRIPTDIKERFVHMGRFLVIAVKSTATMFLTEAWISHDKRLPNETEAEFNTRAKAAVKDGVFWHPTRQEAAVAMIQWVEDGKVCNHMRAWEIVRERGTARLGEIIDDGAMETMETSGRMSTYIMKPEPVSDTVALAAKTVLKSIGLTGF